MGWNFRPCTRSAQQGGVRFDLGGEQGGDALGGDGHGDVEGGGAHLHGRRPVGETSSLGSSERVLRPHRT